MSLSAVLRVQHALAVIASLMLTAHFFPKQAVVNDFDEFDFIIVGGGSAGSVIADRLTECSQFKVLVIEAGDDPPVESLVPSLFSFLPRTAIDWNITTVNDHVTAQSHTQKTLSLTSGHVLGGGSSVNYMYYVRECRTDFDVWAKVAKDSSWNYDGVYPFYIKSEKLLNEDILNSKFRDYHGVDGFLGVTRGDAEGTQKYLDAFKEIGHQTVLDINGKINLGYTIPLLTIADGMRQTTAYTNLGVNKHRPNLHVLKNTLVTEILFDRQNNAIGVKALTNSDKLITIKAKNEVIISAGALNTPKLLMLSGIGPKKHLQSLKIKVRRNLPVGENYQDHTVIPGAIKMEKSQKPQEPGDPRKFPVTSFVGYVALNKSNTCPDYQVINFLIPNDSDIPYDLCLFNIGLEEHLCKSFQEAGRGRNLLMLFINLLHPKSRGRLLLRSTNPMDTPLIYPNTFGDESDLKDIARSFEDYVEVLNTTYFKNVNAEFVDIKIKKCMGLQYFSREYWRCYVETMMTTMFHYSGTCAMGSVVDSELRVLNVNRLRVADASVIPSLTSGNINAPVIMIAEKVAHLIKQSYSSVKGNDDC